MDADLRRHIKHVYRDNDIALTDVNMGEDLVADLGSGESIVESQYGGGIS